MINAKARGRADVEQMITDGELERAVFLLPEPPIAAGMPTSFVAWRLNAVNFAGADELFHNRYRIGTQDKWGDPADWDDAARALGITVDQHPAQGAVAQRERGSNTAYGSVAYVEEVHHDSTGDISFVVLSYMNADGLAVSTDPATWTLEEEDRARSQSATTAWDGPTSSFTSTMWPPTRQHDPLSAMFVVPGPFTMHPLAWTA